MSQKSCCVPGCPITLEDGVPLHQFPNPETNADKFKTWISNIGGEITALDQITVYKNRRVCHRHFEDCYLYPKNRLCILAVPVLHMPEGCTSTSVCEPPTNICAQTVSILPSCSTATEHSGFQKGNEQIKEQANQLQVLGSKCSKKKKTVLKGVRVSVQEHKEYKLLLKQLKKCKEEKTSFKRRYIMAKKMTKTAAFTVITKKMSSSAKTLCQMQFSQSGKKKQGRRFTLEEKILALSLYKPSPKSYRLLSKLCVLPSRKTLQNLLRKLSLKAGVNDIIFQNLKRRVNKMPKSHKYCALLFDEMAIGPGVSYDKKNDRLIGFVDDGEKCTTEYCDHVLVFMIRGIIKKYKQPVAYYYCRGSTKTVDLKNQIQKIFKKVQETGLKVVATVCDQVHLTLRPSTV